MKPLSIRFPGMGGEDGVVGVLAVALEEAGGALCVDEGLGDHLAEGLGADMVGAGEGGEEAGGLRSLKARRWISL